MKEPVTPHYQFICHPYSCALSSSVNNKVTFDVMDRDLSRDELLEQFAYFMKACGYHISPDECISIIEVDE